MTDIERDDEAPEAAVNRLRVLERRTPVTTGWHAPDTVRRTAVRRRRTRWSTGAAVLLAGAVAAALSIGGRAAPRTAPPRALAGGSVHAIAGGDGSIQLVANAAPIGAGDASQTDAVAAAEQRLGLAMLAKLGTGSNVAVSPASLYIALGMLQNGARGRTADEISTALQASGLGTDEQNAGLAALTDQLTAAAVKDGIALDSANSMWQQEGFTVDPQFLRELSAYYRSGVWQVDFADHTSDAMKAINHWTSDQTHGKITKLFDHLDPDTVMVLANAIYFHAAWATPFEPSETIDEPFTRSDGSHINAKFMMGAGGLRGAVTAGYQAAELPYRGGRFAALALMPTSGSLASFVAGLTPAKIRSIATSLTPGMPVSMPRFTMTSTMDLVPVLKALGMRTAFTTRADLSGLSPEPARVDQVIQRVYLGVGERGTTAAAVTGSSVVGLSGRAGPAVQLDHPFVFLVRDTVTGAILFASEVTDPSAS